LRGIESDPTDQILAGPDKDDEIMSAITIGLLGILLLFLLLAMRMQIGFSMAVVGFIGFAVLTSLTPSFSILGMEPFKIGAAYSLTVIPLFILMGQFANHSGMGFEISLPDLCLKQNFGHQMSKPADTFLDL